MSNDRIINDMCNCGNTYVLPSPRPAVNSIIKDGSIPLNIGCIVEEGTSYDVTDGNMICDTLGCTNVIRYKQPYCASNDVLCPGRYKERMVGDGNGSRLMSISEPLKPLTGVQLLIFMMMVMLFLVLLTGSSNKAFNNVNKKDRIIHHISSSTDSPVGGFPPCLRDETYTYL